MTDPLRSSKGIACFVFKKHYNNLSCGLQDHLPALGSNLYSFDLISVDTRNRSVENTNQLVRCMCLLNDVEERIKRDHSAFEKFCGVLCSQGVGLAHLGEPMLCDYQQLCEKSPKPTLPGSCSSQQDNYDTVSSVEPSAESQAEAIDQDTPVAQPSRSTYDPRIYTRAPLFVKSFETPQQALSSAGDDAGEQVVPVKETSGGKSDCSLTPLDLSVDRFAAKCSDRALQQEERRLVGDMKISWDKVVKCENCTTTQSEYSRKLEDVKQYYDKQLEDGKAKLVSAQEEVKELTTNNQCLLGTIDIQSKDKCTKLKETKAEIEQLKHDVEQLKRVLNEKEKLLDQKIMEEARLRSAIGSNEKELHILKQYAQCCPIFGNERRMKNFEQKKALCTQMQSLVVQFFSSQNPDEKSKLQDEIQAKLSRFTFLERHRSYSL